VAWPKAYGSCDWFSFPLPLGPTTYIKNKIKIFKFLKKKKKKKKEKKRRRRRRSSCDRFSELSKIWKAPYVFGLPFPMQ
jgi:hypothetical protein